MSSPADEEEISPSMFEEPEDFRPPPPPSHFVQYDRFVLDPKTGQPSTVTAKPQQISGPESIKLRLIGSSPLWGHLLWNAGKFTAHYLDTHPELIKNKTILELGAAGGLPSLICSLHEPAKVVSTDYPDLELINNIKYNFQELATQNPSFADTIANNVLVEGYIWSNEYTNLTKFIAKDSTTSANAKFDLIILSDLVFNHTEHHKLLQTCRDLINKATGKCLVVFSPHRAHLLENDLEFFELAQTEKYGFDVEKIDLVHWNPMFEENEETMEIRGRVYSFWLIPKKQ